jgi:hypothetical protein
MSSNSNQFQSPFLVTSKKFSTDPVELEPILSKAWVDTANNVNIRTIGIFDKVQIVSGNKYYSTDPANAQNKRQSYRQIYSFGAIAQGATLTIAHGISGIIEVVNFYGNCITDVSVTPNGKYKPLPYVTAIGGVTLQTAIYMNDTIITIVNGAGADNIVSGTIIVEYTLN